MKTITYITGNDRKFQNAAAFFKRYDIDIEQQKLDLTEIQAPSAKDVAIKKARDAYTIIGRPIFVNDASWHISALNGFPGPYMRYVLDCFTIDDILNLMKPKQDRSIILKDTIVYKDNAVEQVFTNDVTGRLLHTPTEGEGPFITKLITFADDGTSLAQMKSAGFTEREMPLWEEFANWLITKS